MRVSSEQPPHSWLWYGLKGHAGRRTDSSTTEEGFGAQPGAVPPAAAAARCPALHLLSCMPGSQPASIVHPRATWAHSHLMQIPSSYVAFHRVEHFCLGTGRICPTPSSHPCTAGAAPWGTWVLLLTVGSSCPKGLPTPGPPPSPQTEVFSDTEHPGSAACCQEVSGQLALPGSIACCFLADNILLLCTSVIWGRLSNLYGL